MARNMTTIEAAQGLLTRVTEQTLTHSYRRTPAGFISLLTNRWQFLAASAGVPGIPKIESVLRSQYIAIREQLHRLGYQYPDDNDPDTRFDQLTRATYGMLGKNTKAEILWTQLVERKPTFLDAFVIASQWVINIDDARAEKNNVAWKERENRTREKEQTRMLNMITTMREEIQLNQQRIDQLTLVNTRLNQDINDLMTQLRAHSGTESSPSQKPLTDSGNDHRPAAALAGDSGLLPTEKIE
jgi:hypothetical protein